ncbi:MAG: hypothetical protein U1F66_03235 [bacterium]
MSLWKKSLTFLAVGALLAGSAVSHEAQAAKKKAGGAAKSAAPATGDNAKISSDPDAPTVKENRLLKWGPVDPPDRGKSKEFFVRGIFVNMEPSKDGIKDTYELTLLPVEIVENEYRNITADHFASGMTVHAFLPKDLKKQFKQGAMVEVHNYYLLKEAQAIGHAKMIDFEFHSEIVPYPAGPAAYVKKGGLDPEQYLNALKGMEMFGNNPKDDELKTGLDALASSSPNAEVKAKAAAMLSSLFGAQPSGRALLPAATATAEAPAKGKKK